MNAPPLQQTIVQTDSLLQNREVKQNKQLVIESALSVLQNSPISRRLPLNTLSAPRLFSSFRGISFLRYLRIFIKQFANRLMQEIFELLPLTQRTEEHWELIATLLQGISSSEERADIFSMIQTISQDDRLDCIKKVVRLMQDTQSKHSRADLLQTLSKIPLQQREDLMNDLSYFFHSEVVNDLNLSCVIDLLQLIPHTQRKTHEIYLLLQWLSTNSSHFLVISLIQAMRKIPQEERVDAIQKAAHLSLQSLDTWIYYLKVIKTIPSHERNDCMEKAFSFFSKEHSIQNIKVYYLIATIPTDQRPFCIEVALFLVKKLPHQTALLILETLIDLPREQRITVPRSLLESFFQAIEGIQKDRSIFYTYDVIPCQRLAFIECVTPLLQNLSLFAYTSVFDKQQLLQNARFFFSNPLTQLTSIQSLIKQWIPCLTSLSPASLRQEATLIFASALCDRVVVTTLTNPTAQKLLPQHYAQMFFLLFSCFHLSYDEVQRLGNILTKGKAFKDKSRQRILFSSMLSLLKSVLPVEESKHLLLLLFSHLPQDNFVEKLINSFAMLEAICLLNPLDLRKITSLDQLEPILQNLFMQTTGITRIEHFTQKYLQTFGSFRQNNAICLYVGKIKALADLDKTTALTALNTFIEEVLEGTFIQNRYHLSPHLSTVFAKNEKLKMLWMQEEKAVLDFQSWTVIDTDHPNDLLLCGTEIDGSCQNIYQERINTGLLGYLLDGKNRLIAIKNSEGRIMARCLLKILWDGDTPVLLQERIYCKAGINPQVLDSLQDLCVRKAQKMGLVLVADRAKDFPLKPYPKPLLSLGNRASFEYCDAEANGLTNGYFILHDMQIVFAPSKSSF